MNRLAPLPSPTLPAPVLVAPAGPRARTRIFEFFAANIRNKHTRCAYAQATREFLAPVRGRRRDEVSLDEVERILV